MRQDSETIGIRQHRAQKRSSRFFYGSGAEELPASGVTAVIKFSPSIGEIMGITPVYLESETVTAAGGETADHVQADESDGDPPATA